MEDNDVNQDTLNDSCTEDQDWTEDQDGDDDDVLHYQSSTVFVHSLDGATDPYSISHSTDDTTGQKAEYDGVCVLSSPNVELEQSTDEPTTTTMKSKGGPKKWNDMLRRHLVKIGGGKKAQTDDSRKSIADVISGSFQKFFGRSSVYDEKEKYPEFADGFDSNSSTHESEVDRMQSNHHQLKLTNDDGEGEEDSEEEDSDELMWSDNEFDEDDFYANLETFDQEADEHKKDETDEGEEVRRTQSIQFTEQSSTQTSTQATQAHNMTHVVTPLSVIDYEMYPVTTHSTQSPTKRDLTEDGQQLYEIIDFRDYMISDEQQLDDKQQRQNTVDNNSDLKSKCCQSKEDDFVISDSEKADKTALDKTAMKLSKLSSDNSCFVESKDLLRRLNTIDDDDDTVGINNSRLTRDGLSRNGIRSVVLTNEEPTGRMNRLAKQKPTPGRQSFSSLKSETKWIPSKPSDSSDSMPAAVTKPGVANSCSTYFSSPGAKRVTRPSAANVTNPGATGIAKSSFNCIIAKPSITCSTAPVSVTGLTNPSVPVLKESSITSATTKPSAYCSATPSVTVPTKPIITTKPNVNCSSQPNVTNRAKPIVAILTKPSVISATTKPCVPVLTKPSVTSTKTKPSDTGPTKPSDTYATVKPGFSCSTQPSDTVLKKPGFTVLKMPSDTLLKKPDITVLKKPDITVLKKPSDTVLTESTCATTQPSTNSSTAKYPDATSMKNLHVYSVVDRAERTAVACGATKPTSTLASIGAKKVDFQGRNLEEFERISSQTVEMTDASRQSETDASRTQSPNIFDMIRMFEGNRHAAEKSSSNQIGFNRKTTGLRGSHEGIDDDSRPDGLKKSKPMSDQRSYSSTKQTSAPPPIPARKCFDSNSGPPSGRALPSKSGMSSMKEDASSWEDVPPPPSFRRRPPEPKSDSPTDFYLAPTEDSDPSAEAVRKVEDDVIVAYVDNAVFRRAPVPITAKSQPLPPLPSNPPPKPKRFAGSSGSPGSTRGTGTSSNESPMEQKKNAAELNFSRGRSSVPAIPSVPKPPMPFRKSSDVNIGGQLAFDADELEEVRRTLGKKPDRRIFSENDEPIASASRPKPPLPPSSASSSSSSTAAAAAATRISASEKDKKWKTSPGIPAQDHVMNAKDESTSALEQQPWYHGNVDRKECEALIRNQGQNGRFIVRQRCGDDADLYPYTLTVMINSLTQNVRIRRRTDDTFALGTEKANENIFNDIVEMVNFHRINPIILNNNIRVTLTSSPARR